MVGRSWNAGPASRQSSFTPENLTTFARFSVSSAISLPNSAGEPGSTVPPSSARYGHESRDRSDISDKIEIEVFVKRRIDCVAGTHQKKRVSVRGCAYDRLSGDIAVRARPVLYNAWLAEPLREPLTHQACGDVITATRGVSNNPAHRPKRISLRRRDKRCERQRGGQVHNCGHRISAGAVQSSGDRLLSNDIRGLRIEISHQARGAQSLAGSAANGPVALRNRHPEEPYAKLRRPTFHEARPRSCGALGKAKMNESVSPNVTRSLEANVSLGRRQSNRLASRVRLRERAAVPT